tara:strand:- start:247 stop:717 length:471 start_codon:yes stop_codon:yes gene_type:complete
MSTYIPSSWGRTRRPKECEPRLPDSTYNTSPTKANILIAAARGDLNAALNDAAEANNGYSTENQRYLHVFIKDNPATGATTNAADIYVYNYAFKEWAPLQIKSTHAAGYETANVQEIGIQGVGRHYIFDISGIDRVAFVKSTSTAPHRIRIACTTF